MDLIFSLSHPPKSDLMEQCFQKEYKLAVGVDAFSDPFGFHSAPQPGGKGKGKKGDKGPSPEELLELKRLGMTDFKSKGRGGGGGGKGGKGGGKGKKGDRDEDGKGGKGGKRGKRDDDDYVPDELRHYVIGGKGGSSGPQKAGLDIVISSTNEKQIKKLEKTLKDIERLEKMVEEGKTLDKDQQKKLDSRDSVAAELARLVK